MQRTLADSADTEPSGAGVAGTAERSRAAARLAGGAGESIACGKGGGGAACHCQALLKAPVQEGGRQQIGEACLAYARAWAGILEGQGRRHHALRGGKGSGA